MEIKPPISIPRLDAWGPETSLGNEVLHRVEVAFAEATKLPANTTQASWALLLARLDILWRQHMNEHMEHGVLDKTPPPMLETMPLALITAKIALLEAEIARLKEAILRIGG